MKEISIRMLKIMLLVAIGVCLLSIVSNVKAMELSESAVTISKGETVTLLATENNKPIAVGCSSTGTGEVSITNFDGTIFITGKEEGTVTVTVKAITDSTKVATCTVTVISSGETNGSSDDADIDVDGTGETISLVVELVIKTIELILTKILPLILGIIGSAI